MPLEQRRQRRAVPEPLCARHAPGEHHSIKKRSAGFSFCYHLGDGDVRDDADAARADDLSAALSSAASPFDLDRRERDSSAGAAEHVGDDDRLHLLGAVGYRDEDTLGIV